MRLVAWDALPEEMRNEWVRPYYEALAKKRVQLVGKRCFDAVWEAIPYLQVSHYVRPSRPDGERGDHRR